MAALNESQTRSIKSALLDVHQRMAELEALIAPLGPPSPFSRHVNDLAPTEAKVLRDHFAQIRTAMLVNLKEFDIPLDVRPTSLRWALQTAISFISIAVEELRPSRLRGYGKLAPEAVAQTNRLCDDLTRLVDRLAAYLRQGSGRDLQQRIARLDGAGLGVASLVQIEKIITRWELLEYRPTLEMIVRRLEKPMLELAVFGRISSGKSSLLNHIAGLDVLPVGVTPVTAVPTRLEHGETATAVVSFADSAPRQIETGQLWEYASEEGNRGNRRHVTAILVEVPSPRLKAGVVLVDTPGVGSLATSGAAEAIAYLPRCDLGIVLFDAASTLEADDLMLLRTLYEAGIPAMVLLSKADLLSSSDRERLVAYNQEMIQRELGLELAVQPVSVVGAELSRLLDWFDSEISPLFERHQALAEASLQRKVASLAELVATSLESLLPRSDGVEDGEASAGFLEARRVLDHADDAIRRARKQVLEWSMGRQRVLESILQLAAQTAGAGDHSPARHDPLRHVAREVLAQRAGTAHELVGVLKEALRTAMDGLQQALPMADPASAFGADLKPAGLPIPDLTLLHARASELRPWWASALPAIAVRAARVRLEERFGKAIGESIATYDRRLQNWASSEVERLVKHFELGAAPIREQVRRYAAAAGRSTPAQDQAKVEALQADFRTLRPLSKTGLASGPTPVNLGQTPVTPTAILKARTVSPNQ
jgi:GTP-binding protein EngB required for normal cell division